MGSVGDSYHNALAETMIGLYKTELIEREWPLKSHEQVKYQTCKWVDWFNNWHLMEGLGEVPPAEYEHAYHAAKHGQAMRT